MPPLPADFIHARACKLKCEKILTRPLFQHIFFYFYFHMSKLLFKRKKRLDGILFHQVVSLHFYDSTNRNVFSSIWSWTIFVLGDMPTGYLLSCCKCPFRKSKALRSIKQHHRSPNKNNECCTIRHYFVAKLQTRVTQERKLILFLFTTAFIFKF